MKKLLLIPATAIVGVLAFAGCTSGHATTVKPAPARFVPEYPGQLPQPAWVSLNGHLFWLNTQTGALTDAHQ